MATPGWQYWNKDPQFAERVFQNTREIIRRDRNHPSVLMWEPILNETRYPKDFALKSLQLTKDEYPYPYRPVAVADWNSAGVKEIMMWLRMAGYGYERHQPVCLYPRVW